MVGSDPIAGKRPAEMVYVPTGGRPSHECHTSYRSTFAGSLRPHHG